jgi:hypothetical protein
LDVSLARQKDLLERRRVRHRRVERRDDADGGVEEIKGLDIQYMLTGSVAAGWSGSWWRQDSDDHARVTRRAPL